MSDITNSHSSVSTGTTEDADSTTFALPDDVPTLMAMRKAIDAKIQAAQSTGVAALLAKFADEAAALGKTPEEILGIATGKKRGRKPKSNRDEA